MKVTERLSRPLSMSTLNQVSQGGLERAAEQDVPEQLTLTGPCCRDTEPIPRTSGQVPPSIPSPEQSATEMDREEAKSGTYNLKRTRGLSRHMLGRVRTKGIEGFLLEACRLVRSSGLLEELTLLQHRRIHGSSDC